MLNRKMRRDMGRDKNMIENMYSVIVKYFPDLIGKLARLSDQRNQSYTTYSMKTICVTRLFGLLCGITELVTMSDEFNKDGVIKNIGEVCNKKLEEIPHWETIQDVFVNMQISELREIQKYMVATLIRSKMFDRYKYAGAFQLIFDGTGLSHHDYNLNDNCLTKKHKSGKITYHKYVLECKLCAGPLVISLDTEFVENEEMNTENDKQDCEINAFKRMVKRIKKNFPKQKFIITGDALYATKPVISICEEYGWLYIFNLKPERLKSINESFEDNINYHNETTHPNYYLSTNIEYKGYFVNVFKYIESEGKSKGCTFRYISNIESKNDNIKELVAIGRRRWKIENCGFYTQKHRTFNISHMCSRNDNAMKCHYFFIQFAHTIRQLFEKGLAVVKELGLKLKQVSARILSALTSPQTNLVELDLNFQLRFDD